MYMRGNKDNQMEPTEVAYIAGLIDGEGTIRMQRVVYPGKEKQWNPKFTPTISFTNTNLDSVRFVQDFFGGKRIIHKHISGKNAFKGNKPCYRAHRGGRLAVTQILKQLLPYLRIKKRQAELIIEFNKSFVEAKAIGYRDGKRGGKESDSDELKRREDIYQQITSLNRYRTSND